MKILNSKGITLISIIITIIVMIIIAGVTISNVVGNNSVIDRAQSSKQDAEKRTKQDALQQYLNKYNSKSFVGSNSFIEFLKNELGFTENDYKIPLDGESGVTYYEIAYLGETFFIREIGDFCEIAETLPKNIEELFKYLEKGDIIIAPTTEIEAGYSYVIVETANLNDYSYDIPANSEVTIKLFSDITITNEGLERSAINLNENSILNLKIYSNVEVNSSYGKDPERANGEPGEPGEGGYAGIHVPESATLRLYGDGTITARGGDAGNGSDAMAGDIGGSGGGGAGAGIGGHGGKGGAGGLKIAVDGGDGENCGTVIIYDTITVNSYGGAGGSSGILSKENAKDSGSGTGAGGYPAAGIGGGGAGGGGGNHVFGGGGYSAGSPENDAKYAVQHDGNASTFHVGNYAAGGSYYQNGTISRLYTDANKSYGSHIGGQSCFYTWQSANTTYYSITRCLGGNVGSGGYAGCGGTISVSKEAKINAKNGNKYTAPTSNKNEPTEIYIQNGEPLDVYIGNAGPESLIKENYTKLKNALKLNVTLGTTWKYATKYTEITEYKVTPSMRNISYAATSYGQGIGSGAGYVEISNGTYKVIDE